MVTTIPTHVAYQVNRVSVKPPSSSSHLQVPSQTQSRSTSPSDCTPRSSSSSEEEVYTTVRIGPKQKKFRVIKRHLCAASPFFRERLQDAHASSRKISLWLPGESPSMFALFAEWLACPRNFRRCLEATISAACDRTYEVLQELHWALIRLHLFASHLNIAHLQDLAMDGIQDLYLKCDWDVTSELITYLYTNCEGLAAVRLRRWAVAMVAFSLTGATSTTKPARDSYTSLDSPTSAFAPSQFHDLLDTLPEFAADHAVHMDKMEDSGLDVRFKNPQLRIPANKLRNEERAFGFRQCSFHTHRAIVGERRCPYERRSSKAAKEVIMQLGTRNKESMMPAPLFSVDERDEDFAKALKHVRSISSTMI